MARDSNFDKRRIKEKIAQKSSRNAVSYSRNCHNNVIYSKLSYFNNLMITTKSFMKLSLLVALMTCSVCCSGNSDNAGEAKTLTPNQEELINEGWYIPQTTPNGELSEEYGVKNRYGQQDNYFDIQIGKGCDVAVKIIDEATDKCIRYAYIPENSTVNIQMIPQGKYYLKLAYGKGWMEYNNDDNSVSGKFTSNAWYDRSVDIFDFGKKNSSNTVSYILKINVADSNLQNNFETVEITEDDFMK